MSQMSRVPQASLTTPKSPISSQSARVQLGTAKIDITPTFPVELQTPRPGPTTEVSRRIYARVALFRQLDEQGQERYVLIVSADVIYFVRQRIESLRRKIKERWNIPAESIILQGTHTHSAPVQGHRFDERLDGPYESFIHLLEDSIMTGIEQAMSDLEPVMMERGMGSCDIATHRRKMVSGEIAMAPNPDGPVDREVTVLRFKAVDPEKTKCFLVHYTCHPTTTYENKISSEYPGAAMEYLEQESTLDPNGVSIFLQGCCGDIKVNVTRDGKYYQGTDVEVARFGRALADRVQEVLGRPMADVPFTSFVYRHTRVQLPYQSQPTQEELRAHQDRQDMYGQWSRILQDHPERNKPFEWLDLYYIRLGQGLSLVAMNGEIVVEYGLYIKEISGHEALPMGYSNGHTTYIPTAQQLKEGGYEGRRVFYLSGRPSPFSPKIEQNIKAALTALIDE